MALGRSLIRVRQSGSRRYTHSAVMSPTISRSSSAAVDSFAGMARANRPTAIVPAPGRAVLEKPTISAPRVTSSQAPTPRSGASAARSGMTGELISATPVRALPSAGQQRLPMSPTSRSLRDRERAVEQSGDLGEHLVHRPFGEGGHERFDLHRAGVAGGADGAEEALEVDDAGVEGQAAVQVLLLVDLAVGAGVVEVHRDDVRIGEALELRGVLPRGVPVVGVEDESHVRGARLGDQLARLAQGVDEGEALGGPEGLRADVLQAQPEARVLEQGGDQRDAALVQAPVLAVVELLVHGADPGAHAGHAGGGEQLEV